MDSVSATAPRGNLALAIALIVAAVLCVAVMSAFGKAAAAPPTSVIGFFQSFISLLLFLPWVRCIPSPACSRRSSTSGSVKQRGWQRTPIEPAAAASLAVGFVGVRLIIRPGPALLTDPSSLIALSAAAFSAIALVTVNTLSRTDAADTILFYYFLVAPVTTAPFAALEWQTPTGRERGLLIGIGAFYITSARETPTPDMLRSGPLAGSLFGVRSGRRRLPARRFAG